MKDRAMQALHLLALAPVAETTADRKLLRAFVLAEARQTPLGKASSCCPTRMSAAWVLEGDIRGCFLDNISHEWMLRHVPADKEVLRKWLKAGFMENRILFPTEAGTPQGGIISPTLANLTLDGLEPLLKQHFPRKYVDGKTISPKINLIRYADDFIITGTTKDVLENEVQPLVEQFLRDRGRGSSRPRKPVSHISSKGSIFLGQKPPQVWRQVCSSNPPRRTCTNFLKRCGNWIRRNKAVGSEVFDQDAQPGHPGAGQIITVISRQHRHSESGNGHLAASSGIGPNVGTPTGQWTGSPSDTGSGWAGNAARSRQTPARGRRTESRNCFSWWTRKSHPAIREGQIGSQSV